MLWRKQAKVRRKSIYIKKKNWRVLQYKVALFLWNVFWMIGFLNPKTVGNSFLRCNGFHCIIRPWDTSSGGTLVSSIITFWLTISMEPQNKTWCTSIVRSMRQLTPIQRLPNKYGLATWLVPSKNVFRDSPGQLNKLSVTMLAVSSTESCICRPVCGPKGLAICSQKRLRIDILRLLRMKTNLPPDAVYFCHVKTSKQE